MDLQDDPICIAARREGKTLVTGLWVDHSFDVGMPVDPTSVSFSTFFLSLFSFLQFFSIIVLICFTNVSSSF